MTSPVEIISPDDTIETAARMMAACDCGVLPVGQNDRLVGMITDRDIVTRAVAAGVDLDDCLVGDVMTPEVRYCYEDETADDLARNMEALQIKRLPVLNRQKRLVGIVSCGDLAVHPQGDTFEAAAIALKGISQPGRDVTGVPL
jgi:CBS domain-containing protein